MRTMDYRWLRRVYQATPALLLLVLAAGCATSRPPDVASSPSPRGSGDFLRLIRHGCYRCLEEAIADSEKRMASTDTFEAAALLVLRSKELGLPTEPWLGRARTLAAADAMLAPLLMMVEAVPPPPMSDDRDALV